MQDRQERRVFRGFGVLDERPHWRLSSQTPTALPVCTTFTLTAIGTNQRLSLAHLGSRSSRILRRCFSETVCTIGQFTISLPLCLTVSPRLNARHSYVYVPPHRVLSDGVGSMNFLPAVRRVVGTTADGIALDLIGLWVGAWRVQEYAHPTQGASGRAVRRSGQAAAGRLPPQGRADPTAVQAAQ